MFLLLEGKTRWFTPAKCLQELYSTVYSRFLRQAQCGRWSSSGDGKGCKRFSEQKNEKAVVGK